MGITKNCENCNKEFEVQRVKRILTSRFCCRNCLFKSMKLTPEGSILRIKKVYDSNVIKKENCWEWIGWLGARGYGKISYGTKYISAHRASWLIQKGEIPEGLYVCHSCDNPPCTNPDHLFLGTAKDNARDRTNKGRNNTYDRSGERNHMHKLNEQQVIEIKNLLNEGIFAKEISNKYGVSTTQIYYIRDKKTWKNIHN